MVCAEVLQESSSYSKYFPCSLIFRDLEWNYILVGGQLKPLSCVLCNGLCRVNIPFSVLGKNNT